MDLQQLFEGLAAAFDGPEQIEATAQAALGRAARGARYDGEVAPLRDVFLAEMAVEGAHPVCQLIAQTRLAWGAPTTSDDPAYLASGVGKVHVELLGPDGIVRSDEVRLGLYGMLPHSDYGIRTHPAEEVFVMLAGQAEWKRGDDPYCLEGVGTRSYHPSMMEHATRTGPRPFLSVYAWTGDISTDGYVYAGPPKG